MRDFFVIFRRNTLSPIVIAILILAIILMILGDFRDAWFLSVVIVVNTLLAIIQEVRAARVLKKLELMSAPTARRINSDGSTEEILFDKLIPGNLISLNLGDEIPADGKIITSAGLEADEGILTGESAPIEKNKGSMVYAASAVVAGSATMKVEFVGQNTKVGTMASTLKRYSPVLTPIQHSISVAITWLTFGALGLSVLILVVYYFSGQDAVIIFKTIASGAVVIVPEGLLLASSLLFAYGSLKLAQAKVLPQKLAAIEAMALLDVLCVDKTGTLTSDEIKFEAYEEFNTSEPKILDLVGIAVNETSSGSSTSEALQKGLKPHGRYKIMQTLAFSSARKMSGVKVELAGNVFNIIIGAPEYVSKFAPLDSSQKQRVEMLTNEGKRVLLVGLSREAKSSVKDLKDGSGQAMGLLILSNDLRVGVEKTINYLQKNGVSLRVISGDNPNTVKYIASMAGIANNGSVLTGAELQKINKRNWNKVVSETTIFARVLPEQKEKLIETFKELNNFTGMVGDGVNDALALKKSDLGVAMYSGAVATRRVADIVLLDNSFNSLPIGMRLGNRIIQAIELIATLFFHKIIFGLVLILTTLIFGFVYPLEPRHITFMNILLVTMPTLMWTLFPPSPQQRLSPRHFWRDTLLAVAPIAVLSGVMITSAYTLLHIMHPNDAMGVSTTTVIIATFFGVYLVYLVPRMFNVKNNRKSQIARILYTVAVLAVISVSFGFDYFRDFFNFSMPAGRSTWPLLVVVFGTAILQWIIAGRAGKRIRLQD
ncbi:MAG: HAD-IC family P-type ATPase [Candidatus Saccharibacteria bacterium]|nr:HAD-IC family P-type ATPase [Candidatus Saccharibacteria bacterium]